MNDSRTHLYRSENGDTWSLCRATDGSTVVLHEPNARSGGKPSTTGIANFLADGRNGPEHQALRMVIAETLGLE